MEKIHLELTVDQVNTLLNVLGELPHNKVHELMFTIYSQGTTQVSQSKPTDHVQRMSPNVNEVDFEADPIGLS
jgi:hypothetical protein